MAVAWARKIKIKITSKIRRGFLRGGSQAVSTSSLNRFDWKCCAITVLGSGLTRDAAG